MCKAPGSASRPGIFPIASAQNATCLGSARSEDLSVGVLLLHNAPTMPFASPNVDPAPSSFFGAVKPLCELRKAPRRRKETRGMPRSCEMK